MRPGWFRALRPGWDRDAIGHSDPDRGDAGPRLASAALVVHAVFHREHDRAGVHGVGVHDLHEQRLLDPKLGRGPADCTAGEQREPDAAEPPVGISFKRVEVGDGLDDGRQMASDEDGGGREPCVAMERLGGMVERVHQLHPFELERESHDADGRSGRGFDAAADEADRESQGVDRVEDERKGDPGRAGELEHAFRWRGQALHEADRQCPLVRSEPVEQG